MKRFSKTQFSKAQCTALAASVADFGVLTSFVEACRFFYGSASSFQVAMGTAMGAALGALTNFFLNRYWTFQAEHEALGPQALKYALVSGGSLLLNTGGVYLLVELLGLYYLAAKGVIAIAVSVLYNYPLHRYFVYKEKI